MKHRLRYLACVAICVSFCGERGLSSAVAQSGVAAPPYGAAPYAGAQPPQVPGGYPPPAYPPAAGVPAPGVPPQYQGPAYPAPSYQGPAYQMPAGQMPSGQMPGQYPLSPGGPYQQSAPFQAPPGTQLYTSPNVAPAEAPLPTGPTAPGSFVPGQVSASGARLVYEATVVANVNGEVIMASEILRPLEQFMAERRKEIPDDQVDAVRMQLAKQRLGDLIEQKLIYQDAMSTIPESNHEMINDRFDEQFSQSEIKRVMTEMGVNSPAQLDTTLRQQGDSLERMKRRFREQMLARQWVMRETHDESEITHEEMLAYYYENAAKYDREASVEWLQLTVRFDRVASKQQAYEQIAWMGNQVMQGADWAEIAKAHSSGPTASEGGRRAATTQGSLVSQVLDEALFGLPVDAMSPILTDAQGYHIVKVLERTPAGRVPFTDVQNEITEKIREQRRQALREKYLAKLKDNPKVWTIFDDPEGVDFFAERNVTPLGPNTLRR